MAKCNACGKEFEQEELNIFSVCHQCVSKQLKENQKAREYAESPEYKKKMRKLMKSIEESIIDPDKLP